MHGRKIKKVLCKTSKYLRIPFNFQWEGGGLSNGSWKIFKKLITWARNSVWDIKT